MTTTYRITRRDEAAGCGWCGYPLDVGDKAYTTRYEDPCCSPKCRDRLELDVELEGEGSS